MGRPENNYEVRLVDREGNIIDHFGYYDELWKARWDRNYNNAFTGTEVSWWEIVDIKTGEVVK